MTADIYHLIRPARQETSVIFASPHSGREYPAAFLAQSQLDARAIRRGMPHDQLLDGARLAHGNSGV